MSEKDLEKLELSEYEDLGDFEDYEDLGDFENIELKNKRKRRLWPKALALIIGILYITSLYGPLILSFTRKDFDYSTAYLKSLETNLAPEWSKKYTSEAHLAGKNDGLTEWTKQKFEEYGFETEVDLYDIYASYPKDHALKLIDDRKGKVAYVASLEEDVLEEDKTSGGSDRVPTFLGYAANGNVTAKYVYVNYGRKEDFAQLKKWGVSVKDKIAVARYGKIFRGLKVKFAQEHGAAGVLLYSDPGDDFGITPANGYKQYPHGPARHESSVQRGSVQFLGGVKATPGDPTTPGYASKPGVERKDPHRSIGKIPALPISYREVKPILEKLNGKGVNASEDWNGALDGFDYWTGPNDEYSLNLYNEQEFNITKMDNVYGKIEGEKKDEVILIGNHRDAWIKGGAGDPNSGSAVMIEVARAFGELKKAGFKFKRSIVLQSWDGEEYGLLGSTEYGEYAAKELKSKVVAYFNLDTAVTGSRLDLEASPLLHSVLRETAKKIDYPDEKEGTLYDHFVKESKDHIGNLGSGSDYTVFLEHLGIPSVDMGFASKKGDSIYQYHSNYDSYYWMERFGDKGFVFHNLMAKYLGLAVLDLSEQEVINFKLDDYANDLIKYYEEVLDEIPKDWYERELPHHGKLHNKLRSKNERFVYESSDGVYGDYTLKDRISYNFRKAMKYCFKTRSGDRHAYPGGHAKHMSSMGCGENARAELLKHKIPLKPHHRSFGESHDDDDRSHSSEFYLLAKHGFKGKHHGFKGKLRDDDEEEHIMRAGENDEHHSYKGKHHGYKGKHHDDDEEKAHLKEGGENEDHHSYKGKHHGYRGKHHGYKGKHHDNDEEEEHLMRVGENEDHHSYKGKHHGYRGKHHGYKGKHHDDDEEKEHLMRVGENDEHHSYKGKHHGYRGKHHDNDEEKAHLKEGGENEDHHSYKGKHHGYRGKHHDFKGKHHDDDEEEHLMRVGENDEHHSYKGKHHGYRGKHHDDDEEKAHLKEGGENQDHHSYKGKHHGYRGKHHDFKGKHHDDDEEEHLMRVGENDEHHSYKGKHHGYRGKHHGYKGKHDMGDSKVGRTFAKIFGGCGGKKHGYPLRKFEHSKILYEKTEPTKLSNLTSLILDELKTLKSSSIIFDENSSYLQLQFDKKDSLSWWKRIRLFFKIKGHNKQLQFFERNFLSAHGLHKRPWFKHLVFASGRYTGYAGQTFPSLREAIEDGDFKRFIHSLNVVSHALRRANSVISA